MRDLRYALRLLAARPAFSAVAVLTLALGIGANTAIFTVVNAVLLRPLPFRDADRLVLLLERAAQFPVQTTSWLNYVDWRDQSRSFDAVAAVRAFTMTLSGGSEPERLPAKMATASLLSALGIAPQLGRAFGPDDDKAGAAGVALLSDALWHRRFGGAPDVLGRVITLDNQPYTVRRRPPAELPAARRGRRADSDGPVGGDAAGRSLVASRNSAGRAAQSGRRRWRRHGRR